MKPPLSTLFIALLIAFLLYLPARAQITSLSSFPVSGQSASSAAVADFNGDGFLDVCVGDLVTQRSIFLGQAGGTFIYNPVSTNLPSASGVRAGDIDGDSDIDLWLGSFIGPGEVWLNDGTASFTFSQALGGAKGREDGELVDIDDDNDLDLFDTAINSASVLYLNDGSGQLIDSGQTFGGNIRACTVGYVNGGQRLDIVEESIIWLQQPAGNFTRLTSAYPGDTPGTGIFDVDIGDMNGWK